MSTFDPVAFQEQIIEEANETKTTPLPEEDYECFIKDAKVNKWTNRDGEDQPVLDIRFQVLPGDEHYEQVKNMLNRDELFIDHRIFLDVKNGALAFGPNQNVQLGKLRAATGLNDPKKKFTFSQLVEQGPVVVSVGMREGPDGEPRNRVKGIRTPE